MPDKKLTDNEIVKALECVPKDISGYIIDENNKIKLVCNEDVLDLINRLQVEVEKLNLDTAELEAKNFVKDKLLEKAEIKLEEAEDTIQYADKELKKSEAENERLKEELNILSQKRFNMFERVEYVGKIKAESKAEAYKEFAELLFKKAERRNHNSEYHYVLADDIVDLLKELVGDDKCS